MMLRIPIKMRNTKAKEAYFPPFTSLIGLFKTGIRTQQSVWLSWKYTPHDRMRQADVRWDEWGFSRVYFPDGLLLLLPDLVWVVEHGKR